MGGTSVSAWMSGNSECAICLPWIIFQLLERGSPGRPASPGRTSPTDEQMLHVSTDVSRQTQGQQGEWVVRGWWETGIKLMFGTCVFRLG